MLVVLSGGVLDVIDVIGVVGAIGVCRYAILSPLVYTYSTLITTDTTNIFNFGATN